MSEHDNDAPALHVVQHNLAKQRESFEGVVHASDFSSTDIFLFQEPPYYPIGTPLSFSADPSPIYGLPQAHNYFFFFPPGPFFPDKPPRAAILISKRFDISHISLFPPLCFGRDLVTIQLRVPSFPYPLLISSIYNAPENSSDERAAENFILGYNTQHPAWILAGDLNRRHRRGIHTTMSHSDSLRLQTIYMNICATFHSPLSTFGLSTLADPGLPAPNLTEYMSPLSLITLLLRSLSPILFDIPTGSQNSF